MSRTFELRDGVAVPMSDGINLATDIWLPDGEGPWPVLLQRTPYRRDDPHGAQYISLMEPQAALRRGYAVAVQDTRGRYASEGRFEPFVHEGQDGADTIRWLRAQPFCNGRVAMYGASYVGATQVLAAAENPDGLLAISPHLTTARHGATWMYRGGAVELAFLLLWIIEALAPADLDRRVAEMEPGRADHLRVALAALMADPQGAFARLPVLEPDLLALAPYARDWLDEAAAAAAEGEVERTADLARSRAAMLVSGGWNDVFVEGSIELFELARARHRNGDTSADRLIVGPWSHGNPKDWQGDRWHGHAASTAALPEVQLDFFDAALAGRSPKGPVVRYFRTGSDTWHAAPDWPLPGALERVLHLDGTRLTEQPPDAAWSRDYVSDPRDPVPTVGGATFLPGLLLGRNSGPMDQAAVEARPDVLTFTGEPLEAPLEVTGVVRARLLVRSTADTADWTARLCEVEPEGRSLGLVDGIVRWTRSPAAEDEPTEVEVRLGHVSHLFARGTRLRLQVASSNFPRFDRNPQSGVAPCHATDSAFRPARQALLGRPDGGCHLLLPVVLTPFPTLSDLADK